MYKALTIAGSDTSGGAGIQADLKTFNNYGVYGVTSLTSIVTMDYHDNWSHHVEVLSLPAIQQQLDTCLLGVKPQAIKTGMLPTVEIIELVAENLDKYKGSFPIVIDPVMACKGTEPLFPENTKAICEKLLPLASVVTPNQFEAAQLAGMEKVTTLEEAKEAAIKIHALGPEIVVIKAVPQDDLIAELVFDGNVFGSFTHPQLENKYSHGAGCTFSAAITAQLASGKPALQSIAAASSYVFSAIHNSEIINEFYGVLVPEK